MASMSSRSCPGSPDRRTLTATSVGARRSLTAAPGCPGLGQLHQGVAGALAEHAEPPRVREVVVRRPAGELEQFSEHRRVDRARAERLVRPASPDSLLDLHATTLEGHARHRDHEVHLSLSEIVFIALAGMAAGTINTVVGSGTLITFPVAAGLRLRAGHGQRLEHRRAGPGLGLGRDRLPARAGRPACPRASARLDVGARRHHRRGAAAGPALVGLQGDRARVHRDRARADGAQPRIHAGPAAAATSTSNGRGHPGTALAVFVTGVYGGYFGAAQGIILLAILGVALSQDLHRTNALKNVLAGLVNGVAGLYFVFAATRPVGPGRDHRRRRDHRRPARRALRAQAAAAGPARADRGRRHHRDRAAAPQMRAAAAS